jgi:hypothetical protein
LPGEPAQVGLSRFAGPTGTSLSHVPPIKADELRSEFMTFIDAALLIHALAALIAAIARLLIALRHRR